ncbi:MAG: FAD-binding oxidoreductase [Bacteroidia bacterium]
MSSSYWEKEYWLRSLDFVIVGSGLTGLQTALELKKAEPNSSILVVDRAAWSHGASLKNAGFACFANLTEYLDDLTHMSEEEALQLVKDRYDGLVKLRQSFGDKQIDYQEKGSHEIFTKNNKKDLEQSLDYMQKFNNQLHDVLGLDRVFTYRSSKGFQNSMGAISNQYEGQLNTGLLYERLYSTCLQEGIRVMGGLTLESWNQGDQLELHFEEGIELKCKKTILCTNAFSANFAQEDIVPARGQVLVTEQIADCPQGIFMYDKGYYYWREIDNRIMIGGARQIDKIGEQQFAFGKNDKVTLELKRFLRDEVLGREVEIEHSWSGIMGMSTKGHATPIVKELESNVYLGARLGGMGVALSAILAARLKKLVLAL